MNKEEKHNQLVSLIFKEGEGFDKKHGSWIKLNLGDDLFFQLDAWSDAVTLKKGSGEYDYWLGFSGQAITYFGLNWGGFESSVSEDIYDEFLKKLNDRLTRSNPI